MNRFRHGHASFCLFAIVITVCAAEALAQEEQIFDAPGTHEFLVPQGVTEITVEVWGAGGAGGRRTGNQSGTGGGGGGGAYARSELAVTPGETFEVVVGEGGDRNADGEDSYFADPALVRADGGEGVGNRQQTGAAGGTVADSLGDTRWPGGNGADGENASFFFFGDGGGGGSSPGPDAAGNDATDMNGAIAPDGGGDGGDGGEGGFFLFADSSPGDDGLGPGGGGGGASRVSGGGPPTEGGRGADGRVAITFEPVTGPHHIRLEHPGDGLTCSPAQILVIACADEDCTTDFSDPVDVTFTAPAGNWLPNPVTVTGREQVELQYTTAEPVTLEAEATDPEAQSATRCFEGTTETCTMTFFESGFLINIPDHVADTDVSGTIAAVRESDSSEQCVPGFDTETKEVELWSEYLNPSSGSQSVVVDGNGIPTSSPGGTRLLFFNAGGVAEVTLRYPDVGRTELHARYEQTDSSAQDFGLIMQGAGEFVARPDHFELSVPGNPAATSVEPDNDFTAAGSDFDVSVSALNASGDVTPNFGQETPAESVELSASLVAPVSGSPGTLSGSFGAFGEDCDGSSGAAGTACGRFQWTEVGIISLMPELASDAYLGTEDVEGEGLSHVGRFIPDRFAPAIVDPGAFEPFCDVSGTAFAYSGQALSWQDEPLFTLTALNASDGVTRNYTIGDFQRLDLDAGEGSINREVPGSDSSALDRNGDPYPVIDVEEQPLTLDDAASGVMTYRYASSDELTYQKTTDTRVDPFVPDLEFAIDDAVDADGVTIADDDLPVTFVPQTGFELRYGRLHLNNTYGPETRDLIMPMRIEYWDSGRFEQNMDEGCWSYDAGADTTLDPSGLTSASGSGTMVAGEPPSGSEMVLAAPGEGDTGQVEVTFDVPIWLRDDFNGNGSLQNPAATATFGVFRGHDRIMYWREASD